MKSLVILIAACVAACTEHGLLADELRVDLSQDSGRQDVLARGWTQWRVADAEEFTRSFGDVRVTIRRHGAIGRGLTAVWWKAGFDGPAALASDGVTVQGGDRGGQLELFIQGLAPGRHSLTTFHNAVVAQRMSAMKVTLNDVAQREAIQPSSRVLNDADAATVHCEFDGSSACVRLVPDGRGEVDNVILNGFVIDGVDPSRQARKPIPFDDDEHAPASSVLQWTRASNVATQHLYFGTDRDAVRTATMQSREFVATVTGDEFDVGRRLQDGPYFWRVDTVSRDDSGRITTGRVWQFRVGRMAFPGAEGYGRFAIGGRGGRVLEVTNLEDSGPGSLRAAIEAEGPRTVVFRVGGTIKLASKLIVRNPYLTVAGQTAPGDGIAIRGHTFGCLSTHDVILRYLRIRVGDEAQMTMDGTGMSDSDHCIFDHCSVSWSIDEALSSRSAKNITVQRCLIAEALNIAHHKKYEAGKGHSFAASISGNVGSFHHNLLAHCAGRNWSLAGGLNRGGQYAGRLDIRNNVVFNWEHRTTDGGAKAVNFVNNMYVPGPATRVFHLVKPDAGSPPDPQQYFISGNRMLGRPQYDADNWANGGVLVAPALVSQIKLTQPFCESHVTTTTAEMAYDDVLSDVGANVPHFDAVDQRVWSDVKQRRATATGSRSKLPGIIDSQADVGGWPELKGAIALADTDHDGLPDDWERARGLDPQNAADGARDTDGNSFTELEDYLNSLAVSRAVPPIKSR